jgi:hypothetical protein
MTPRTPVLGRATKVIFQTGSAVGAHYAVVSTEWIRTSHRWSGGSLIPNPEFDQQLQGRSYGGRAGRAAEEIVSSMILDPDHVLDPTRFAAIGPPVCLPDGQVVAGNHRALVIKRQSGGGSDEIARTEYAARIFARAHEFGVDAARIQDIATRQRMLVRIVDADAEVDWARMNSFSDEPLSKSFDLLSASARLAIRLRSDSSALEFMRRFRKGRTISDFLGSDRGLMFARRLIDDGVIHAFHGPRLAQKRRKRLRPLVRRELLEMLTFRALGNRRVAEALWADSKLERLIRGGLPILAVSDASNVVWLRARLCEALERHLELDTTLFQEGASRQGLLFEDELPPLSREALSIGAFLRKANRASFELAVSDFVRRSTVSSDADVPGDMFDSPPPDLTTICFEIFGGSGTASVRARARSLEDQLIWIRGRSLEKQEMIRAELIDREVLDSLLEMLSWPPRRVRSRGRPLVPPVGALYAVALLRSFSVPERHFHRHWKLLPKSWECGSWSTFAHRRARWTRGDDAPWPKVMEILRRPFRS